MTQAIHDIVPVIPCKDVKKSIDYYTKKLGFTAEFEWEEDGVLSYAILLIDESTIHLAVAKKISPTTVYVFCEGIEDRYNQYKKNKAKIERDLEDWEWGMREFSIEDPDGNVLIFGEGEEVDEDE